MNTTHPLGTTVLVLGAVLLAFSYHFSQAPLDQISSGLTGHYSDNTMWYFIAGLVVLFSGGFLAASGRHI